MIPAPQWEVKARRSGRPKTAKTAVVTDSSASESESAPPAADLIQKLVSEAKADQIEVGVATATAATEPAPEPYEEETEDDSASAEAPLKVSPFTLDGVSYLLDKSSQDIYCTMTHEKIGVLVTEGDGDGDGKQHILFDDSPTDSEEDDEE